MENNNYYLHNNINTNQLSTKFKPKAINRRTIPAELKNATCKILFNYGPMSICTFPTLYKYIFEQIFPINSLGFDNGLYGYFTELQDVINLERVRSDYRVKLKDMNYFTNTSHIDHGLMFNGNNLNNNIINLNKRYEHIEEKFMILFNPENNALWGKWSHLLEVYPINLVKSPYQQKLESYSIHHKLFTEDIQNFRKIMNKNPQGIRLNELSNHIRIDKKLYNNSSIECIVKSWPEVFFISNTDDCNPIVYDGYTHTYDFDQLLNLARNSPEMIALKAIDSGLYQKTLLLLYEAQHEGLRLAVWKECIRLNFYGKDDLFGSKNNSLFDELKPIELFIALHAVGLVELESDEYSRNDIRIYLPIENFENAFYKLINKLYEIEENKRERRTNSILMERNFNNQLEN